jgi:hypothetical protein
MEIHAFGRASATGKQSHNQQLSNARAQAIGRAVANAFDRQKAASALASGVTVVVDSQGGGDTAARAVREEAERKFHRKFSDAMVEKGQFAYRSAGISLVANAHLSNECFNYHCRQLYQLDLKKEKVPANLLEQKLDEIENGIGPIAKFMGKQAINLLIGRLKKAYKYQIRNLLRDAGKLLEDIPELKWFLFVADFVIIDDVAMLFEFKDYRDVHAIYKYEGDRHGKDFSDNIKAVMYVLGARRYLVKAEKGLQKALQHPRAAPYRQQIQLALDTITQIKGAFDRELDNLSRQDGPIRSILGDQATDAFVTLIKEEDPPEDIRIPMSDWSAPFSFYDHKFYSVDSFSGPARTQSLDVLFKSHLTLDFAGRDEHGYLGYGAAVDLVSYVSVRNSILSGSLTNGLLKRA